MQQHIWPIIAIAMLGAGASAETRTSVLPTPESPAMAAARANRPSLKTAPKFLSGPKSTIPATSLAAGENGTVVVFGILGIDGRFSELTVIQSSRSKTLDEAALSIAAESVFAPALDAAGKEIAVPIKFPVEFSNAKSEGVGGGLLRYKCGQFARDYKWREVKWPNHEKDDLYHLVLGFSSLAKARQPDGSTNFQAFGAANKDFEDRWKKAAADCEAKPEALLIEVFQPEGELMRRMAGGKK